MENKKQGNYKVLAISGYVGFVVITVIAIVMGMSWESDTNRYEAELALAKSQQTAPQIIYQKAEFKDEDVLLYLTDRIDEFNADNVHIVIDMDKVGTSRMTITTTSEVPNLFYDDTIVK